jgi:hypothetical protein
VTPAKFVGDDELQTAYRREPRTVERQHRRLDDAGLLQRIDAEWVRLKTPGAPKSAAADELVQISLAASISRFARN